MKILLSLKDGKFYFSKLIYKYKIFVKIIFDLFKTFYYLLNGDLGLGIGGWGLGIGPNPQSPIPIDCVKYRIILKDYIYIEKKFIYLQK